MLNMLKKLKKQEDDALSKEQYELVEEYKNALIKLHQARNVFENITEPELIDACVHELNAAQSRYSFLLAKIKEEKITINI